MDVNVKELNAYYKQQLDAALGRHDKEGLEGAPAGAAEAARFIDLGAVKDTFCAGWKEAKTYFPMLTWIPFIGKYVAVIMAAMETADKFFVSGFCASQPAPAQTPTTTVHTNVSQKAR